VSLHDSQHCPFSSRSAGRPHARGQTRLRGLRRRTATAWLAGLKGNYDLWQYGEGGCGRSCKIPLTDNRTIGGYELRNDGSCADKLGLDGESAARFIRDADGLLIVIEATRQVLLSVQRLAADMFKDRRNGDCFDAVLLTPDKPTHSQ
jgi:hypothetical protein